MGKKKWNPRDTQRRDTHPQERVKNDGSCRALIGRNLFQIGIFICLLESGRGSTRTVLWVWVWEIDRVHLKP